MSSSLSPFLGRKSMKLARIYNFHDYREYLRENFDILKKHKLSLRKIAKSLNVSNSYLTMILNRKRNLDVKYIESFANYFSLNKSESSYFKNLVILSDSESADERSLAFKNLSKFRSYKNDQAEDVVTHKYLNNWLNVVIRELSFQEDFNEDPDWIKSNIKVTVSTLEIKKSLEFLKKHKLLNIQNSDLLNCSEGIYKLALTRFHKQMLKVTADSIEITERKDRQILGHTRVLSQKNFEKAKLILEEALRKIELIEDSDTNDLTDDLYHFYFIGIPLSNKKKEQNYEQTA